MANDPKTPVDRTDCIAKLNAAMARVERAEQFEMRLRALAAQRDALREALEVAASEIDYGECDYRDERQQTMAFWVEKVQRAARAALAAAGKGGG